jgi:hypothetical protein
MAVSCLSRIFNQAPVKPPITLASQDKACTVSLFYDHKEKPSKGTLSLLNKNISVYSSNSHSYDQEKWMDIVQKIAALPLWGKNYLVAYLDKHSRELRFNESLLASQLEEIANDFLPIRKELERSKQSSERYLREVEEDFQRKIQEIAEEDVILEELEKRDFAGPFQYADILETLFSMGSQKVSLWDRLLFGVWDLKQTRREVCYEKISQLWRQKDPDTDFRFGSCRSVVLEALSHKKHPFHEKIKEVLQGRCRDEYEQDFQSLIDHAKYQYGPFSDPLLRYAGIKKKCTAKVEQEAKRLEITARFIVEKDWMQRRINDLQTMIDTQDLSSLDPYYQECLNQQFWRFN